jgi:hypothetical protein
LALVAAWAAEDLSQSPEERLMAHANSTDAVQDARDQGSRTRPATVARFRSTELVPFDQLLRDGGYARYQAE